MEKPDYDKYILIADAAKEYGTSRQFWYDAIRDGQIAGYELPGRRGTFMLKVDVVKLMQPRQISPEKFSKSDNRTA